MGTHGAPGALCRFSDGGWRRWGLLVLLLGGRVGGNLLPGDLGRGTHHHLHLGQEFGAPDPGHHHHSEQAHQHQHGDEHQHQHQQQHQHQHHEAEERAGRQEPDSEPSGGQLIDFSGAVLDPETGLKCVIEEKTIEAVEREQLLTCTHSMIQVHEGAANLDAIKHLLFNGLLWYYLYKKRNKYSLINRFIFNACMDKGPVISG